MTAPPTPLREWGPDFIRGAQGPDEPGCLAWAASPPKNAMVLTCGDIDHDGDLDVFVGQYKTPDLGQIHGPIVYDVTAFLRLLLNDGHGNFTNVMEAAGSGQAVETCLQPRWPTWTATAILT